MTIPSTLLGILKCADLKECRTRLEGEAAPRRGIFFQERGQKGAPVRNNAQREWAQAVKKLLLLVLKKGPNFFSAPRCDQHLAASNQKKTLNFFPPPSCDQHPCSRIDSPMQLAAAMVPATELPRSAYDSEYYSKEKWPKLSLKTLPPLELV